jgi:RecA-family ATPase
MYFRTVKKDDLRQSTDDIRELEVMKANYAKKGEVVRVRWERGVFVPHGELSPQERLAQDAKIDEIFLTCLDIKTAQGVEVGPRPSPNYAPTQFAAMPQAQELSKDAMVKSMERLFHNARIKLQENSKGRDVIVRGQQVLKLIDGGKEE